MKDRLHRGFKVYLYGIEDIELIDESDVMLIGLNVIELLRSRACRRLDQYLDE